MAKWSDEEIVERLECLLCDPLDPLVREYVEVTLERFRELSGVTASLGELLDGHSTSAHAIDRTKGTYW